VEEEVVNRFGNQEEDLSPSAGSTAKARLRTVRMIPVPARPTLCATGKMVYADMLVCRQVIRSSSLRVLYVVPSRGDPR
jgi:hypothetical protein